MPRLDGAHSHGPSGGGFDWRWAVVIAVVAMIFSGQVTAGIIDGLEAIAIWTAVVFGLAVVVAVAILAVMLRRRTPDYVRSIHGETERDRMLDDNAALRREIRAMRDRPETRPAEYHLHVDAETARQYLTPHALFNQGPFEPDYAAPRPIPGQEEG